MPEQLYLTAFVTFFVIIDPIGMAPIFMALSRGMSRAERHRTAVEAILIAGLTLIVFALAGEAFLEYLGITLPAVRIAGGILLFMLAIDMVFARQSGLRTTTESEEKEAKGRDDVGVFPLAIPLIAGPGAIASVILLMGRTEGSPLDQAIVLLIMLGVLGLTLLAFFFSARLMDWLGVTGINVIGRVLGIILAALAVQYVLEGVADSFPGLMRVGT